MARILSPEAAGTLRAVAELGRIRHFDTVAMELAVLGLAKFNGDHLAVTRKGRLFARIVDGHRFGLRARRRAQRIATVTAQVHRPAHSESTRHPGRGVRPGTAP
jgi:hypothetical protein